MNRSLKLEILWILLEKLDLCKRRLVTSNILLTSGTTQKRGCVTSHVSVSSFAESTVNSARFWLRFRCAQSRLCILVNSAHCTKRVVKLREEEIYQIGSRELTKKNYNAIPVRTTTVFSPAALTGNKRRVGQKISAPLERILFCEHCGIIEIRRRKPDPVKLIDRLADPSSHCSFWLQLWRASFPLSLLGTFTCLLGLSWGNLS